MSQLSSITSHLNALDQYLLIKSSLKGTLGLTAMTLPFFTNLGIYGNLLSEGIGLGMLYWAKNDIQKEVPITDPLKAAKDIRKSLMQKPKSLSNLKKRYTELVDWMTLRIRHPSYSDAYSVLEELRDLLNEGIITDDDVLSLKLSEALEQIEEKGIERNLADVYSELLKQAKNILTSELTRKKFDVFFELLTTEQFSPDTIQVLLAQLLSQIKKNPVNQQNFVSYTNQLNSLDAQFCQYEMERLSIFKRDKGSQHSQDIRVLLDSYTQSVSFQRQVRQNASRKTLSRDSSAFSRQKRATQNQRSYPRTGYSSGCTSFSLSRSDQAKVDDILDNQAQTVGDMAYWVRSYDWDSMSGPKEHFDWWMFPVGKSSNTYGDRFTVNRQIVNQLKKDPVFMENYRKSVRWVMRSWGWDVERNQSANNGRHWTNYPIRLVKIAQSLELFEENSLLKSVKTFRLEKVPLSDLSCWMHQYLR